MRRRTSLRNWEWNYLGRLNHMEDAVLSGHRDAIVAMAFLFSDGRTLRTVSFDKKDKDWDIKSRKGSVNYRHMGEPSSDVRSFRRNGRILYSTCRLSRRPVLLSL